MDDVLHVEIEGPVATVWLNRPEVRNALNALLIGGLREAMASLDANPDIAAIVLTGADPAFCAGIDLHDLAAGTLGGGGSAPPTPADMGTPVVGAVNGAAVTGGLELALACDLLIGSERAAFADTHARIGILPGWGLSVELPCAVGVRRARQMSFTSRRSSGARVGAAQRGRPSRRTRRSSASTCRRRGGRRAGHGVCDETAVLGGRLGDTGRGAHGRTRSKPLLDRARWL
jgi:enoyl-CoA hydratase/carnithine racemase